MANFDTLQFKRGTSTQWTTNNPILSSGEPGFDVTNYVLKVGDGVNPWSTLPDIYSDNTPGITSVIDDVTPQLGGNLDLNSHLVSGVGGINIVGNAIIDGNLDVTGITTVHHVDSVTTLAVSGDITASGTINMPSEISNGVMFVDTNKDVKTDSLFTYNELTNTLDVQKVNASIIFRAYSSGNAVPDKETWQAVFSVADNKPIWFDGANWRDFMGNIV